VRFCLRRVSQCRERLRHQNELSEHHKKLLRRFASVQRIQSDVTPKQDTVSKRRRYGGALRHCSKQRGYRRGAAATRRSFAFQEAVARKCLSRKFQSASAIVGTRTRPCRHHGALPRCRTCIRGQPHPVRSKKDGRARHGFGGNCPVVKLNTVSRAVYPAIRHSVSN
jgi:hypothetical protein